jgi:phage terminase small subunit
MAKLTKAQHDFVNYFIEQDFRNAGEAYKKAYPKASYDTARVEASKFLTKPNIQEYMSAAIAEALARDKVPLEKRIFNYWMKRAFYDITEIISIDGTMKLTDKELREKGLEACIDSINKKIDAQGREIITYKFADKDKAADMLQQYIQMIKVPVQESKIELSGTIDMSPDEQANRIKELLAKAKKKSD